MLNNFTDVQVENYKAKMKGNIWQINGELADVERDSIINGLQSYNIDVKIDTNNLLPLWVSAECIGSNSTVRDRTALTVTSNSFIKI